MEYSGHSLLTLLGRLHKHRVPKQSGRLVLWLIQRCYSAAFSFTVYFLLSPTSDLWHQRGICADVTACFLVFFFSLNPKSTSCPWSQLQKLRSAKAKPNLKSYRKFVTCNSNKHELTWRRVTIPCITWNIFQVGMPCIKWQQSITERESLPVHEGH